MSLWTCIACTARRAVGMLTCPQCGAAEHEDGDTISGAEGVQGQPHIPEAYADAVPAVIPTPAPPASPAAEPLVDSAPAPVEPDSAPAVDTPPAPVPEAGSTP